jgi:hypothetical protein
MNWSVAVGQWVLIDEASGAAYQTDPEGLRPDMGGAGLVEFERHAGHWTDGVAEAQPITEF